MAQKVGIGYQSFREVREENIFYIDKTLFIKEWWEYADKVTLITRPRRFGKTLNLSMLECFFSNQYAGRSDLFEGLAIWDEKSSAGDYEYRQLQGGYPVIALSFASIKTGKTDGIRTAMKQIIANVYQSFRHIMKSELFDEKDRAYFRSVNDDMTDETAYISLNRLCTYLKKFYDTDVIILLDEYDTPMQEAWLAGNWNETVAFFRNFFNATFKTNPHLYRGLITGITRISKESIFSDLNNLEVVSTTSDKYATQFGFTEEEVFQALDDMELGQEKQRVKQWYDGFTFGTHTDIYNAWSIISFISKRGRYDTYWADTSSNGLINSLMQTGVSSVKKTVEELLLGNSFTVPIDEQIVFNQLDASTNAVWSLLLAAGYLKVVAKEELRPDRAGDPQYTLTLTNYEVLLMFRKMVKGWFRIDESDSAYNNFVKALLLDDVDAMNEFMNKIALQSFSSFDVAKSASDADDPERFYHGFVLGMMVDLDGRYVITSNKESGFGRYDIMLKPTDKEKDNAYIIEFKVHKPKREKNLEETVANALAQIAEKQYEAELTAEGIAPECIRKYGFAFEGKMCLIG
ncbi:MAG: ATP-binding protein [Lachnospiraceae bacterium]|nr:ATP-binding protein [Lachnospiraceae bacterium]